ncbi:MAG: ABC transporter ATP-binding protein [Pirellulales bacterium]|nr:ABC transporter ATP-binding protein [Pirellulales bacterium]
MTETPLVELTDVAKTYANGAVALDGFRMTLQDGDFVSLLGPSGCGKSTVLRLIAGLSRPTRGVVRRVWDASSASGSNDDEQPLGCVFQEPTLLPWATVWRNVYLPLRLQGVGSATAKSQVDSALEMVGLTEFASAYPRELSGGMKMRASVARALVTQPRLLLLDEPFAALDEITRNRMNDDLLNIWRQRRWAGLFITHSVFESVYLSTRVLVMSPRPGRVVDEIAIDLPETRTAETRTSPRYIELCRRVSRSLESSAEATAEAAHA